MALEIAKNRQTMAIYFAVTNAFLDKFAYWFCVWVFGFGRVWVGAAHLVGVIPSEGSRERNPFNTKFKRSFVGCTPQDGAERRLVVQTKESLNKFLQLVYVSIACVLTALVNPSFIRGFLYPLYIFKNYGYSIVENQSIIFLEHVNFTQGQHFLLFKMTSGLILALFAGVIVRSWRKIDIATTVLVAVTGFMAYFAIRNFPSFTFFAIPFLAGNIYILLPKKMHPAYTSILVLVAAAVISIAVFNQYQEYALTKPILGFGLLPGAEASANFIKDNNIQGLIFNDYDVGSYLIYNLYPQKVFVDNRPEAYSVDFFHNIYEPAQQDPQKWQALDNQYHFNVIFFSYRDYTPWAQAFLIARVNDPDWAPVFVDNYNIIFLKRNAQNTALIKQYELPKSMFGESVH